MDERADNDDEDAGTGPAAAALRPKPRPHEDGVRTRVAFPFSAIVGQEEMRLALLVAAVDPHVGGVLVFGDRGTGKSTAVRALAALLPPMRAVAGCRYNCDPRAADGALCGDCRARKAAGEALEGRLVPVPVVDLPLGATEDRVVGALDLERALTKGEKAFEPGLLARAHRGFLYIDEANLLEDHLVDLLLDVAASGENVVEREGLSVRHPPASSGRERQPGGGRAQAAAPRPLRPLGRGQDAGDLPSRIEVGAPARRVRAGAGAFAAKWRRRRRQVRRKIASGRSRLRRSACPTRRWSGRRGCAWAWAPTGLRAS
jgi:magnesium chelatase subunit I